MNTLKNVLYVVLVACLTFATIACSGGGSASMETAPVGDYKNLSPHEKIMKATGLGDVAAVKAVLAAEPDLIHARGIGGMTPLHSAAAAGQDDVVKFLLEHGADTNVLDDNSNNAAGAAMYEGHKGTAKIINDWVAKNGQGEAPSK